MEKVIEYVTAIDDMEFGFWPDEGEPDEGELHVLEPTTLFERACRDTIINLQFALKEELVEIAKRFEALES